MRKLSTVFICAAAMALGQYQVGDAGAAPAEAGAAAAMMQPGIAVSGPNGALADYWFRTALPAGPKVEEEGISLPTIPHGALLGLVRFPAAGSERRGQNLKPGLYTLRYSLHPVNGDHLGVAPQRDFLVLTPIAEDKDPNATPDFDTLMNMSRKASGTPHPAVLSMSTGAGDKFPSIAKEGDHDWVLNVKIGDKPVAVIVVGKAEG